MELPVSEDEISVLCYMAEYEHGHYEFTGPELIEKFGWSSRRLGDALELLNGAGFLNLEDYTSLGAAPGGHEFECAGLNAHGRQEYRRRWPHGSEGKSGDSGNMKDIEVQDLFLKELCEMNRSQRGAYWAALDISEVFDVIDLGQVEDVVSLLYSKGLIKYSGSTRDRGRLVSITVDGIEQVELGGLTGNVDELFAQHVTHNTQNVTISGGQGVQVAQGGNPSQTNITYQQVLTQLLQQIDDDDSISEEEKTELKGALQKVIAHPVTNTVLSSLIQLGSAAVG